MKHRQKDARTATLAALPSSAEQPRLYRDLADWYPLLTPVGDYGDDAAFYLRLFKAHCRRPPRTLLDLGSGGGHNAAHLKAAMTCTLVDLSPAMLTLSRRLNPECEHVEGDMRSIRLGRVFDCVLVHDAIVYMSSRADLARAVATAFEHTAPGGVALFQPDFVAETFAPGTETGGSDAAGRGLRYLEWRWAPKANKDVYITDMAYLLRDRSGAVEVIHDRHVMGLFFRAVWLELIADAGFEPLAVTLEQTSSGDAGHHVFLGLRPDPGEGKGEVFFEVYEALPRQGPGNRACAAKALGLCRDLPQAPAILDLGCGVGGQTLHLAQLTSGSIVALDGHAPSIERLKATVTERGLSSRIRPVVGDMARLELPPESFDLIWSEGALYNIGLENALRICHGLLRPGGHLAFTDAVWRKENPPAEVKASFDLDYPAMGWAPQVLAAIDRCGFSLIGHFTLPDEAWWDDFYTPMQRRIGELRGKYAADREALAALEQLAKEPEMHRLHSESYAYEFFVARRR